MQLQYINIQIHSGSIVWPEIPLRHLAHQKQGMGLQHL